MNKLIRQKIFDQASKKLRQDFESLAVIPHRGAKGGEAERLVREFLNRHLPGRFKAGAGFVADKTGNVSRQIDVVSYDAINCPLCRWSEEAASFPADNVAAVVEVKSSLDKVRPSCPCPRGPRHRRASAYESNTRSRTRREAGYGGSTSTFWPSRGDHFFNLLDEKARTAGERRAV